jgi:hypothetical protein
MLFYYCNSTDDMQITIYRQKPGHDCWSWEAIYKVGSSFASWRWRKQVSRTGVGGTKQAVELNDFAVENILTELTKQALLRIGNTDAYRARNMFLEETR